MRRCLKQFPWYARLIAGAVIVLLTALAATAPAVAGNAKPTMAATDPQKRLAAKTEVVFERGTLVLIYDGKIAPGMAEFITDEFNKYRDSS